EAHAARGAVTDGFKHGGPRHHDDRHRWRRIRRQVDDAGPAGTPRDFAVGGIHQVELAAELAVRDEVLEGAPPDAAGTIGRPDQDDRARAEKLVEIVEDRWHAACVVHLSPRVSIPTGPGRSEPGRLLRSARAHLASPFRSMLGA